MIGRTKAAVKKVNAAVYGCGLSASGALGIPNLVVNDKIVTSMETHKPSRIPFFNIRGINKVSAGFGFSLFASNDKLYGTGLNNRFQISTVVPRENAGQDYYISPKRISLPEDGKILGISSGRAHSLVLTTNGVYAFGENNHGQCGVDPEVTETVIGTSEESLRKVEIPTDSGIVAVHCSLDTSFVLTAHGEVFAFGLNEDGQCSNGSYGIQHSPTKIKGDAEKAKIVSISGSTDTILAVSKEGDVFVWGQCEYGQAGEGFADIQVKYSSRIPFTFGKVKSASSSSAGCLALNSEGEVFVWGVGILGMGPNTQKLAKPVLMDQPLFENQKVTKIVAGNCGMAAVNENGRCFIWGQNKFGLLGLGHAKDQYFPYQISLPGSVRDVSIGPDHSLFIIK